jgi:protein CpxP
MSNKTLKIAAITMLILNVCLIALLIIGKPHHPKQPRDIIIEKLDLTDGQIGEYDKLIDIHRSAIGAQQELLKLKKRELYSLLSSDNMSSKNFIIEEIGEINKEIENINFTHFEEIKKMVAVDKVQMNNFYVLTEDLGKMFMHKKGPKRP